MILDTRGHDLIEALLTAYTDRSANIFFRALNLAERNNTLDQSELQLHHATASCSWSIDNWFKSYKTSEAKKKRKYTYYD